MVRRWIHGCKGNPLAELARRAGAGMLVSTDQVCVCERERERVCVCE